MTEARSLAQKDSMELEIEMEDRAKEEAKVVGERQARARAHLQELENRPSLAGSIARRMNPLVPPAMRIDARRYDFVNSTPPSLSNRVQLALASLEGVGLDAEDEMYGDVELLEDEKEGQAAAEAIAAATEPRGRPVASLSGYISPFISAYQNSTDPRRRFELSRLAINDAAVDDFCCAVGKAASIEDLQLARDVIGFVDRAMASHPNFSFSDGRVRLVNPLVVSSLAPCLFSEKTIRPDWDAVLHLESLLVYGMMAEGRMREFLSQLLRDVGCTRSNLLGYGVSKLAKDIQSPGIYLIAPAKGLIYVGMSHSLGLARRTAHYESSEGGSKKLVAVQQSDTPYPGDPLAFMWHGSTIAGAVVPAGAIYGVESILIALTESWQGTTDNDVTHHLNSPDADKDSIVCLNTNMFDKSGAFLLQPSLNAAGAVKLVDFLIQRHTQRQALPEYRGDESASDQEAENFYRSALSGIFPTSTPMSTIYGHIQLKTAILRRAVKSNPRGAAITGLYLPGKNGVQQIKRKWAERLW